MNQKITTSLGTIIIIIIALTAGLFIWQSEKNQMPDETETLNRNPTIDNVICAQDAKQCPDGSYVSRAGLNCEFAPCPGESNTHIIGGQCEYEKIPGTCEIISVTKDNTVSFSFVSKNSLPANNELVKSLSGTHTESLSRLNGQAFAVDPSEKIDCEASLITKGTCTPIIFRFTDTFERSVVCTDEAKQCPDGSFASRTGPNCEFAACAK